MTGAAQKRAALFSACFGDPRSFSDALFSVPGLVACDISAGGVLEGTACLIPVSCVERRGFYVYGVCVSPNKRGNGLFRLVMRECERRARENGAAFLCLIPASQRLALSYEKMGYVTKVLLKAPDFAGNIRLEEPRFKALVTPEDNAVPVFGFGLLKRLDPFYSDKPFVFDDYMGER